MLRPLLCATLALVCSPTLRAADDPLPKGAKFRLGSDRFKINVNLMWHSGALTPDGKALVHPYQCDAIDLATGRGSKWLPTEPGRFAYLDEEPSFSADGTRAAAAIDRKYRVLDADRKELFAVDRAGGFDAVGILSADGTRFAQVDKGRAVVWDVATKKAGPEVKFGDVQFAQVGLSPDGKTLAVAGSLKFKPAVQLWDADTGKELALLKGPDGRAALPAFAPDGKTVAVGGSDEVWVLDATTGAGVKKIGVEKANRHLLQYTPDGKGLLVTAEHGGSEWVDAATGKVLHATRCPVPLKLRARGARFVGNDRAVAWGEDRSTAYAWEVPSGKPLTPVFGHSALVRGLAFAGKEIVTTGYDARTMRWDAATGEFLGTVEFRLARGDFGPYAVPGASGRVAFTERAVYDPTTGTAVAEWPATLRIDRNTPTYPSADGKRVAFLNPGGTVKLTVCDTGTGAVLRELTTPGDTVGAGKADAAISADGTRAVVSVCKRFDFGRPQSATVTTWDADGKKLFDDVVGGARGTPGAVALSPDGGTAYLAHLSGRAFALDAATGKAGTKFGSDQLTATGHVLLSADGKSLAVTEDGPVAPNKIGWRVRVYDTATGKQLHDLDTGDAPVAFSPDNRSLATRSQFSFTVWDLGAK
ncbi:(myosin heavy-chain) kinase : Uncharacterized protein OS=Fusarium oxysporum f. sp. vasinfectum 25433 GN=FOTG_18972 PE=4 SV=1 [Gemmataceae bacterium]|nr:(myosin heavy-chain) kinase : Uncharacterized protein OS=Fusarium oxysporum f. sp. vasinfectum 25433 GN=FOTG_18972 PE=4 SV=1 [Gemmataceae bacterium]VTU01353.1 (myosin heavy-chain) kinase : Uncharacterized protein OS=Fusarium oxysporum f. sp. vasinfectum 25433 GN=FOTG_18972 PE=4 SV=1 [Gemmataceae bacterium]